MSDLDQLLSLARVMCRVEAGSKKRVFELAAATISGSDVGPSRDDIYAQLLAREKLGSTGLGSGVAVPHCRVTGLPQAIGCLITLDNKIDFDSPDNLPVDLLFVLLVPSEATQEHLDLLAAIARRFSKPEYCAALRDAEDAQSLLSSALIDPSGSA